MKKYLLVLVIALLTPFVANAEKISVCAKYRTNYGWSKNYAVEARVMKGSELNQATSSFKYSSFDTYVVIFWDRDEASLIKLKSYFGSLSMFGQEGEDASGRTWEVRQGEICF